MKFQTNYMMSAHFNYAQLLLLMLPFLMSRTPRHKTIYRYTKVDFSQILFTNVLVSKSPLLSSSTHLTRCPHYKCPLKWAVVLISLASSGSGFWWRPVECSLLLNGCSRLLDVAGTGSCCRIPPSIRPKHTQWVTCPVSRLTMQELGVAVTCTHFLEACADCCNTGPCITTQQHEEMVAGKGHNNRP